MPCIISNLDTLETAMGTLGLSQPPSKATWVTLSRYNQWYDDHAELTTLSVFQERTHHLELVYVPHGFIGIRQLLLSWGLLQFRLLRSFSVSPSPLWSFHARITLPFIGIHTVPSTLHFRFGSNKSLYHNTVIRCLALPIYQTLPKIPKNVTLGSCTSTAHFFSLCISPAILSLSRSRSFIIPFNSRLISNLTILLQFGHLII